MAMGAAQRDLSPQENPGSGEKNHIGEHAVTENLQTEVNKSKLHNFW